MRRVVICLIVTFQVARHFKKAGQDQPGGIDLVRLDDSAKDSPSLTLDGDDLKIESYPSFIFYPAGDESGETATRLTGI